MAGQGPRGAEGSGEQQPSGRHLVVLGHPKTREPLPVGLRAAPSPQQVDEGGKTTQGHAAAQRVTGQNEVQGASRGPEGRGERVARGDEVGAVGSGPRGTACLPLAGSTREGLGSPEAWALTRGHPPSSLGLASGSARDPTCLSRAGPAAAGQAGAQAGREPPHRPKLTAYWTLWLPWAPHGRVANVVGMEVLDVLEVSVAAT